MLKQYFSSEPPSALLNQPQILMVMPFNGRCESAQIGVIQSGLTLLDELSVSEVWAVDDSISQGESNGNQWRKTDDIIFISHWLTEEECQSIESSSYDAYTAILSMASAQGYDEPLRFWNYLPGINCGEGDEELYKRFCTGRLKAFRHSGLLDSDFPAASALGHHTKGASIYLLAGKKQAQHFANDNQVNPYHYPREYGVSSPSFARATAVDIANAAYVFISGTASIVGHKTVAQNDLLKQLVITCDNIEHLLLTANPQSLPLSALKVYLRHKSDAHIARQWLSKRYPDIQCVYTLADICRSDLLVEIEAFCSGKPPQHLSRVSQC